MRPFFEYSKVPTFFAVKIMNTVTKKCPKWKVEVLKLKKCIVCNEQNERGIVIVNQFICHECEKEIIHTEVEHAIYPFFLSKLKKINVSAVK